MKTQRTLPRRPKVKVELLKTPTALQSYIDRCPPPIAITAYFVPYGYQVNYWAKGEEIGVGCRDFSGSYAIADIATIFVEEMQKAVERARKRVDKELD